MRRFIVGMTVLFFSCFTVASQAPLAGELTQTHLLAQYSQFNDEFKQFQPTQQDIKSIKKLAGKELLVLFGTWCHDSQREVPRLLKLLDESKVNIKSLKLVAVGYDKRDPQGIAEQYNLAYTPTIIVFDNGKEIARMIEKPAQSIAVDLTQFK